MPRFEKDSLTHEEIEKLKELSLLCRGDIIKMTTLAGSGHPGGSMSSIDIYLILYSYANISPVTCTSPDHDRIVVSHGHTSPGVYAALGRLSYFKIEDTVIGFRKFGSPFEGHVVSRVPGVEWSTGNLGQGLAAGCGFALASRLLKSNFHTFVAMSDGEQTKGQVGEARRFAKKFRLDNLTVIIDYNQLQISGRTHDIMPINIKENYLADGWATFEIDGHDFSSIYNALRQGIKNDRPTAIIARTVMGKGVSFMEHNPEFHGRALTIEEAGRALAELSIVNDLPELAEKRKKKRIKPAKEKRFFAVNIDTRRPILYDKAVDNRKALGNALNDIARGNLSVKGRMPIAVFDCDLAESIRTKEFGRMYPQNFFEAGVQEHSTATIAGALSIFNVVTIYGDFGVFAIDEVYNQLRLNDLNNTNLKIFATHLGIDVGPDGKTHHCLGYIGILKNLYNFKIIIPADPNQADKAVRYALKQPGNFLIGVGRSKNPLIYNESNKLFFGIDYHFTYGKADLVRQGKNGAIITMGPMLARAIEAHDILKRKGHSVMVVNVPSPFKLDQAILNKAYRTGLVVTYEDHNVATGLGSIVAQHIADSGLQLKFKRTGIKSYAGSDENAALYLSQRLDVNSLVRVVLKELRSKTRRR